MGMSDTVRCEYPLPNPGHQGLEFQTKSLECLLDEYTITREGRLIRHARRGALGHGPIRDVEWPIHGDIEIYESLESESGERTWVEYLVRFTHGRVEWVRPVQRGEGATIADESRVQPLPPIRQRDLVPGLRGRPLSVEEYLAHTPEKLELLEGRIPGGEDLLMLLLVSVGLRRAAELVGPEQWALAVGSGEP